MDATKIVDGAAVVMLGVCATVIVLLIKSSGKRRD